MYKQTSPQEVRIVLERFGTGQKPAAFTFFWSLEKLNRGWQLQADTNLFAYPTKIL